MIKGKIVRISGPIIYAEGLDGCGLYDVVDAGNKKIIGEIIRQNKGLATIQVYEEENRRGGCFISETSFLKARSRPCGNYL